MPSKRDVRPAWLQNSDAKKLKNREQIYDVLAMARRPAGSDEPRPCPLCGTDGLVIDDRSARPHVEWYAVMCSTCGLDDVISIPTPQTWMR